MQCIGRNYVLRRGVCPSVCHKPGCFTEMAEWTELICGTEAVLGRGTKTIGYLKNRGTYFLLELLIVPNWYSVDFCLFFPHAFRRLLIDTVEVYSRAVAARKALLYRFAPKRTLK